MGERSGAGAAARPLDEPATDGDGSTREEEAGSDNKLPFFFLGQKGTGKWNDSDQKEQREEGEITVSASQHSASDRSQLMHLLHAFPTPSLFSCSSLTFQILTATCPS